MKDEHENHMKAVPENATPPESVEVKSDTLPCPVGFDPAFWDKWGRPNQEHYLKTINKSNETGGHK